MNTRMPTIDALQQIRKEYAPRRPTPQKKALATADLVRETGRNIKAPFGVDFDCRSLRSDCRQESRLAARRSVPASVRVLDCILAPAFVLPWGSACPILGCARFRFYEFSVVLEVMPAEKNRSASLVARNCWAMREGRPFVVTFLSGFSIRSERSALYD